MLQYRFYISLLKVDVDCAELVGQVYHVSLPLG